MRIFHEFSATFTRSNLYGMGNGKNNEKSYLIYLSYGIQLMCGAGIAIWLGDLIDEKIKTKIPLFIWILPLIILVLMLVKMVKEFSGKQK